MNKQAWETEHALKVLCVGGGDGGGVCVWESRNQKIYIVKSMTFQNALEHLY